MKNPFSNQEKIERYKKSLLDTDDAILVSTHPQVQGYKIVKNLGFVSGIVVRSRSLGMNFIANTMAIFGGEIKKYTELLALSRNEAKNRMVEEAKRKGANAVLQVYSDTCEINGSMDELFFYGTAVIIEKEKGK